MSDYNPYQTPQSESVPAEYHEGMTLTASMIEYLRDAAPWLRFMGVIGFIGAGALAIFGIIFLITGGTAAELLNNEDNINAGILRALGGGVVGIVYIAIGALYFFPARWTYLFGAKIRNYVLSSNHIELEAAFRNNKFLWKFNGIITIVGLAVIPVLLVVMIIAVVSSM
ncbi:MAG: hypothetical protein Pg6A_17950 [Termitinemataceae bacterium]|nr:MAG: hypothetical protein Pg6A_17950 [Termitinemataceae bacterium]